MVAAILLFFGCYAGIGGLFGLLFIWRGIDRVDAAAHGSPWTFRLLILPGVMALWPMLAVRWRRATRGEEPS